MSDSQTSCPECGAIWRDGWTCDYYFGELNSREYVNLAGSGVVHHLNVICHSVQHPSRFTEEALAWYRERLTGLVEGRLTVDDLRQEGRDHDQSRRNWKITRRTPAEPVLKHWTMTVADVATRPVEEHVELVKQWAASIVEDWKAERV